MQEKRNFILSAQNRGSLTFTRRSALNHSVSPSEVTSHTASRSNQAALGDSPHPRGPPGRSAGPPAPRVVLRRGAHQVGATRGRSDLPARTVPPNPHGTAPARGCARRGSQRRVLPAPHRGASHGLGFPSASRRERAVPELYLGHFQVTTHSPKFTAEIRVAGEGGTGWKREVNTDLYLSLK